MGWHGGMEINRDPVPKRLKRPAKTSRSLLQRFTRRSVANGFILRNFEILFVLKRTIIPLEEFRKD